MNIDNLIREAVLKLKDKWGLPQSGFIAGGSIANLVWEMVSGKEAIINDIDVFIFDGLISEIDETNKSLLFKYRENETKYWEDYTGMRYGSFNKDFYVIESSQNDGVFNNVKYKSNSTDTDIILRSFDINATKAGYSIEEDKCYWTPEFEEFLNSGELKVCNLMTPSHTAIRIVKKKDELNCRLDDFEMKLIRYAIFSRFNDVFKLRFKSRYFEMFQKYSKSLSDYFEIKRDTDIEDYVRLNFNEDTQIYYLSTKGEVKHENESMEIVQVNKLFEDQNLCRIHNSFEFLFYMRNIYGKDNLPEVWSKLYFFFNDIEYIDCQPNKSDLELLSRLGKYAPNSIENLRGKKLSEQIELVKWILEKYKEDPIVAISILEKHKISQEKLDEHDLFLLELSVRKQIVNDTRGKVRKIIDSKKIDDISLIKEVFKF